MHSLGLKNCTLQKIQNGASFPQQPIQAAVITNTNLPISSSTRHEQHLWFLYRSQLLPHNDVSSRELPLQGWAAAKDSWGGFELSKSRGFLLQVPSSIKTRRKNSSETFEQMLWCERVSWKNSVSPDCTGSLGCWANTEMLVIGDAKIQHCTQTQPEPGVQRQPGGSSIQTGVTEHPNTSPGPTQLLNSRGAHWKPHVPVLGLLLLSPDSQGPGRIQAALHREQGPANQHLQHPASIFSSSESKQLPASIHALQG